MTDALTGSALLRAVLEDPGDDAGRLVHADWLEEHGEDARAEFVRVQVELAPLGTGQITGHEGCGRPECKECRRRALRRRERELLDAFFAYRGEEEGVRLNDTFAPGWWLTFDRDGGVLLFDPESGDEVADHVILRRGFVETVRLSLPGFLKHARELFSQQPITRVEASDRRASRDHADCHSFFCSTLDGEAWTARHGAPSFSPSLHNLPCSLWKLLPGAGRLGRKSYPTPEAAIVALSTACVCLGRSLADLSPLPPA